MKQKVIIYVPGLNDDAPFNKKLIHLLPVIWRYYGYTIYPVYPHWNEGKNFLPKLENIVKTIDMVSAKGYTIYLIGQSAGGSAVLNAFAERKTKVEKVINVGGRLKKGKNVFPSLNFAARGNPAFAESVLFFEHINEKKLTKKDRRKVLTIRPIFDEVVPKSTVSLDSATNIVIPVIEHSLGGIAALTIFSQKIRDFIEQEILYHDETISNR